MVDLNFCNIFVIVMMDDISDLGQSCAPPPPSTGEISQERKVQMRLGWSKEDFLHSQIRIDALDHRLSSSSPIRK